MNDIIATQLNKTYYVRSKISYYPISHSIHPMPGGMSVVIFKNQEDIDQYFQIRGINDPDDFEIKSVISLYDLMLEVADLGFVGIWYFNNFPIFFGNYISDIDIELPSFAYINDDHFIGASGEIESPKKFIPWKNFQKTDKIIQRFVNYADGVPFNPKDDLFTIVFSDESRFERVTFGGKEHLIRYCNFHDASPLQGPYVSDMGAYCLFTDEVFARRYLQNSSVLDTSIYAVEKFDGIHVFLDEISKTFPFIDIGINPGNERYLQGYFMRQYDQKLIKTVLGTYELQDDNTLKELKGINNAFDNDTIQNPNTLNPLSRGLRTTIKNPLKNVLGTTKSSLPRREAEQIIKRLIKKSNYMNYPDEGYISIESKDISNDSFLIYGFDKVSGHSFSNNDEMVKPFVFHDIFDAILYFYHSHLIYDYRLRLEGYYYCQSNGNFEGSQDEQQEQYLLSEQRLALRDLMEMILTDGYKVEHGELLKSFINRSSESLEIEACGYLGDLAIYEEDIPFFITNDLDENEADITIKIAQKAKSYRDRSSSKIELDEKYQNKIRIYLGGSYENLSVESLCILQSAIEQFKDIKQRINHDYAGISMKLCKAFERELNILIFQRWKENLFKKYTKADLKNHLKGSERKHDITTQKLIGWLLKKNKLELGSMTFVIKRIISQCDNEILTHLKTYILDLKNNDFLLSQDFLKASQEISSRYRNGGVHEKIVTYDICKEAFNNILIQKDCYLKKLTNI